MRDLTKVDYAKGEYYKRINQLEFLRFQDYAKGKGIFSKVLHSIALFKKRLH